MRLFRWYWNTARLYITSDDLFEERYGFLVGLFVPVGLIGGVWLSISEWRSSGDLVYSLMSGLRVTGGILALVGLFSLLGRALKLIEAPRIPRVGSKGSGNDPAAILAEGWQRIDPQGRPHSQISVSVWDQGEERWQPGTLAVRLDTHRRRLRSPLHILWASVHINGVLAVENSIYVWVTEHQAQDGSPVFDVYSEQWDANSEGFDELFRRWIAVRDTATMKLVMKYSPERSTKQGPDSIRATSLLPRGRPPVGRPAT